MKMRKAIWLWILLLAVPSWAGNFGDIPSTAPLDWANTTLSVFGGYRSVSNTVAATTGSAPTITVNWRLSNVQSVTLAHTDTATITLSNPLAGGRYMLILVQDGSGNHAVNLAISGVKWLGGSTPTQTLTADKKDIISLVYDGTDYLGSYAENF